MTHIEIYTTQWCPYCIRAKRLLDSKGLEYQEIRVDKSVEQTQIMVNRSGRSTVPQIFINGAHIGGSDDLLAADSSGELKRILSEANNTPAN